MASGSVKLDQLDLFLSPPLHPCPGKLSLSTGPSTARSHYIELLRALSLIPAFSRFCRTRLGVGRMHLIGWLHWSRMHLFRLHVQLLLSLGQLTDRQ